MTITPKRRVEEEEERLKQLKTFHKNKVLFDRERVMRQLRDARSQAEALESYLATLNPAYRQAAAASQKRTEIQEMADRAFRGRMAPEEVMRFYPTSYGRLREALS